MLPIRRNGSNGWFQSLGEVALGAAGVEPAAGVAPELAGEDVADDDAAGDDAAGGGGFFAPVSPAHAEADSANADNPSATQRRPARRRELIVATTLPWAASRAGTSGGRRSRRSAPRCIWRHARHVPGERHAFHRNLCDKPPNDECIHSA